MLNGLLIVSMISTVVEAVQEALEPTVTYVPKEENLAHRDENGEVVIENSQLYYDDMIHYPPLQIEKWIKQGRYNLTPEELEEENKRIEEKWKRIYSY